MLFLLLIFLWNKSIFNTFNNPINLMKFFCNFFSNKWKTGKGKKVKRSSSCHSLSNCYLVTGLRDNLDNLNNYISLESLQISYTIALLCIVLTTANHTPHQFPFSYFSLAKEMFVGNTVFSKEKEREQFKDHLSSWSIVSFLLS